MTNPRMRVAAIAGSMALTLSIAAAPAATAQDDPASTFNEFAEAFAALDLAAMPTFFCETEAEALGGIGLADITAGMPPGFDFILDAFSIDMNVRSVEVVSQSDTEAVLDVDATATMSVDFEAIMPMLTEMMESFGATEADIAEMQQDMAGDIPAAEEIELSGQITLVPGETRPWVICSNLGMLTGDMIDDGMSDDGMTEEDMTEEDMTEDEMEEDGE